MTEIYRWFGIKVDPEATVLEMFDPTKIIEKTMPPITKQIIAKKALNLLARVSDLYILCWKGSIEKL